MDGLEKQLNLFDTVNKAQVEKIIKTEKWQEFHENGKLLIDGEIAVVHESSKATYDYRTGFKGYDGIAVCRIGVWTKYFDNGQLAWQLDYGDGTHEYRSDKSFPSFRKDGTLIVGS